VPGKEIDRAIDGWRLLAMTERSTLTRRLDHAKKRKSTTDASEILHRRYFEGRPEMLASLEEARANARLLANL